MLKRLRLLAISTTLAALALFACAPAQHDRATALSLADAAVERPIGGDANAKMASVYTFEAIAPDGAVRWRESVHNVVVDEGLNQLLDKTFKGSGYTAAWFCGLIDNANFGAINNDDTAARITTSAPSHPTTNNWRESTAYSNGSRPTLTLGTVSSQSVSNSASKCAFTINATATIKGAFTVTNSTKGGTTGNLYSATAFASNRDVLSGDTLNVTITLTTSR